MLSQPIWIITPVYNAEKTIKKCIRSIQNQTYTDWRLIIVDDGSLDKSGKICDRFAKKDERIRVLHTKNAGPGVARKKGLSLIPDEGYCAFCDSDDWMHPKALELLVNEVEKSGADLVCGKMLRALFGITLPNQGYHTCFYNPGYYDYGRMLEKLYVSSFGSYDFPITLWGKVIRISKLKKVVFENIETPFSYAEDLDVIMRLMPTLKDVSVIDEVVYYYSMGGGTARFMKHFLPDSLFMYNRKKEYARYYPDTQRALRMTANEIVSFSMSHLIMCERFKTYPHDDLLSEAEYICNLPEIRDALSLLGEDDSGHFRGTGKAFVNYDYEYLTDFARQQAENRKYKDMLLKILFR